MPTDGSNRVRPREDRGLYLATHHDARLHVLYVVDERIFGSTPALSGYEEFLEQVADEAEDLVEEIIEEATERGLESTTSVHRGLPHQEILDYIDDHDIDVVVMGKRGAGAGQSSHLGSVTDRVLRGATIPVIPV